MRALQQCTRLAELQPGMALAQIGVIAVSSLSNRTAEASIAATGAIDFPSKLATPSRIPMRKIAVTPRLLLLR